MAFSFHDRAARKRKPVIVNGYVDETESDAVFVMAGYVAPADEWAKFSDAWAAALAARPKISALKTNDAMRAPPRGEFWGVSEELRDEKLRLFYSIIEAHVGYSASCVVHLEPLKRIFANSDLPKQAANPYYHCIASLVSSVARLQIMQGVEDEKVDWIFDERVMEQGKFLSIWDALIHDAPEDVKPLIGGTPVFKPDDGPNGARPLQAADLEAWWLRRRWDEKLKGLPRLEYPWRPEPIPECASVLDEDAIQEIFERMLIAREHLAILDPTGKYFG